MLKSFFLNIYNRIDTNLKFPYLKKGDIGVQIGFDLSSKNLTTDLLNISRKVGDSGIAIGIDPDPTNHDKIKKVIKERGIKNVILVEKGTFDSTSELDLVLGTRASHNELAVIAQEGNKNLKEETIKVKLEPLDDILAQLGVDLKKVKQVNVTNNGAEYKTLLGMQKLLTSSNDMAITAIAGRKSNLGFTNTDKKDYEIIAEYLKDLNYYSKFYSLKNLFWGGFVNLFLLKRVWIYSKKKDIMGVVMARKGKRLKFYQSFS